MPKRDDKVQVEMSALESTMVFGKFQVIIFRHRITFGINDIQSKKYTNKGIRPIKDFHENRKSNHETAIFLTLGSSIRSVSCSPSAHRVLHLDLKHS